MIFKGIFRFRVNWFQGDIFDLERVKASDKNAIFLCAPY